MATKKKDTPAVLEKTPYDRKSKRSYVGVVGRRREAVARVRLHKEAVTWEGSEVKLGEAYVNFKPIDAYFKDTVVKKSLDEILKSTNTGGKYAFTIKVAGGGIHGQMEAALHGIANAMVEANPDHRPLLKKKGLLTRDPRARQRRKVGMGGKSRRKKQSPKR